MLDRPPAAIPFRQRSQGVGTECACLGAQGHRQRIAVMSFAICRSGPDELIDEGDSARAGRVTSVASVRVKLAAAQYITQNARRARRAAETRTLGKRVSNLRSVVGMKRATRS